jgi:hypothetical protein
LEKIFQKRGLSIALGAIDLCGQYERSASCAENDVALTKIATSLFLKTVSTQFTNDGRTLTAHPAVATAPGR